MSASEETLLTAISRWLEAEPAVQSAVLFGSSARTVEATAVADGWSDFDLHVVTSDAERLLRTDWNGALPAAGFALQVVRPATGGMRKATVLFAAGQIDLVLVPSSAMRLARLGMGCGLHRRPGALRVALNEMATCLASGYRFLKGEQRWGAFYARVAAEMPGVRLTDAAASALADVFLCDLLWVLQKLERGELAAAQHALHRSLAETNFRLVRELRLRRALPLPSFGLGRRVETMLPPDELGWVRVSATSDRAELAAAAWRAHDGLRSLMRELVPGWDVPTQMAQLLARHAPR